MSQTKLIKIKKRTLVPYLVRHFGLLPVLFLGLYFAFPYLFGLLVTFLIFVVAHDVWRIRLRVRSEPYRSQMHEHLDGVSVDRFFIAFLSVVLTSMALSPLIASIHYFPLVSLAIGMAVAWLLLRVTRRPRPNYDAAYESQ